MADETAPVTAGGNKSLFDTIWAGCEESLKALKKPFFMAKFKREMAQARDDAGLQRIQALSDLNDLREDLEEYDINEVLAVRAKIASAEDTVRFVEEEYLELFGKPMPKVQD